MTEPFNPQFQLPVTVVAGDIDELGHVNNMVYLRWAQDIATAHWRAVATPAMLEASLWVVVRHEIDYLKSAFEGEQLLVETRVGEAHGPKFDRHVRILRAGTLLARARTTWVHLDLATRRPRRVPAEMVGLFAAS